MTCQFLDNFKVIKRERRKGYRKTDENIWLEWELKRPTGILVTSSFTKDIELFQIQLQQSKQ